MTVRVFADSEFIVGYLIVDFDLIFDFSCLRHFSYFIKEVTS